MVPITRILCPVDFTPFSRHALARAYAVAGMHDATVTALHVVTIPPPLFAPQLETQEPVPLGLAQAERERLLDELREFTAVAHPRPVPVTLEVVEARTVHGEILAQADRLGADLIVLGTHGRSGFQRLLMGSVAEKVLRLARQPVMTVGAATRDDDADAGFARILCGIDFSDCSIAALDYALAIAAPGGQLIAMNVVEWAPAGYDPLVGPATDLAGFRLAAEAQAHARLEELVTARNAGYKRSVEVLIGAGRPHHEILTLAADRGCDLIVLGIHGRGAVDRMLFGSTAEPVVRRAPCAVLTVRAASVETA